MKSGNLIRPLLALTLLTLFSFSITPRYFLHQWFATHQDSRGVIPANDQQHISHGLINCQTDHIVAESPFMASAELFSLNPVVHFPVYQEDKPGSSPTLTSLLFSLRGPPAMA